MRTLCMGIIGRKDEGTVMMTMCAMEWLGRMDEPKHALCNPYQHIAMKNRG